MTRLYSSFDLGKIVADEDARREEERKDAGAAARRAAIEKKRAALGQDAPADTSSVAAPITPLVVPVPVSLQALDLSKFRLGETDREYHLFGLPLGETFVDLAVTKECLNDNDAPHAQADWRDHPEYRKIGEEAYVLPSGPEFEAVVEAAAAYRPVGGAQSRLLVGLQKVVIADLTSWVLTRSRVRFAVQGSDELSSDYGWTYVPTMNLKGPDTPITPQSGLDPGLGALLATTTARFCAARDALGVAPGTLFRWKTPRDSQDCQLSVGNNVVIIGHDHLSARGVRYLPKNAGGRS